MTTAARPVNASGDEPAPLVVQHSEGKPGKLAKRPKRPSKSRRLGKSLEPGCSERRLLYGTPHHRYGAGIAMRDSSDDSAAASNEEGPATRPAHYHLCGVGSDAREVRSVIQGTGYIPTERLIRPDAKQMQGRPGRAGQGIAGRPLSIRWLFSTVCEEFLSLRI